MINQSDRQDNADLRRTGSVTKAELPTTRQLEWPTLKVLESLGGSASTEQIARALAEFLSIPEEIARILHGSGPETELEYRAAWARTYLKKIGAVENPSRGIWRITNRGRQIPDERTLLEIIKNNTQLPRSPSLDELPAIHELAWPTLKVLKSLGRPASIKQISRTLAQVLQIRRELIEIPHDDGLLSEFNYRALCARTSLKSIGAVVENASNGMWNLADIGRQIPDERTLLGMLEIEGDGRGEDSTRWSDELLGLLQKMDAKSFISLCKQVLIESGFRQIDVTDKTGSGDILGSGILRISLISFHILFQFRRSASPIDSAEIRDLRGAMVGRAEKGLFVTTGEFTDSASKEAVRDGAPVIDLINGIELCNHLRDLKLGVSTRAVRVIEVDTEYFTD